MHCQLDDASVFTEGVDGVTGEEARVLSNSGHDLQRTFKDSDVTENDRDQLSQVGHKNICLHSIHNHNGLSFFVLYYLDSLQP